MNRTSDTIGDTIAVTIGRSDPAARATFAVRRTDPMMVLDLLLAIQREQDPTLGFRYSCRVAMCGTCTLRLDGRPVLACQTRVQPEWAAVRLDPLPGLPVVRDLIVDMAPFFDEWARVMPYLVPRDDLDEPAVIPPDAPERQLIDPRLSCITCGACYASCAIASYRRDFLGPAALNRALVLIADSRDAAGPARLAAVTGADGVDRCHYAYGCTAVCPKGLDPAGAIRALRRLRARRQAADGRRQNEVGRSGGRAVDEGAAGDHRRAS
ncbi:MAG TPA: succinate dehydrogenase/fumarate reductase iron-sulfur subunit [Thermomicrobiales bacterium]|nr:succinate dehydrogenase/fumarate reductase iron-sulfur subunit [Thermomicrobiales bacterium]